LYAKPVYNRVTIILHLIHVYYIMTDVIIHITKASVRIYRNQLYIRVNFLFTPLSAPSRMSFISVRSYPFFFFFFYFSFNCFVSSAISSRYSANQGELRFPCFFILSLIRFIFISMYHPFYIYKYESSIFAYIILCYYTYNYYIIII